VVVCGYCRYVNIGHAFYYAFVHKWRILQCMPSDRVRAHLHWHSPPVMSGVCFFRDGRTDYYLLVFLMEDWSLVVGFAILV
jgi:hypothetical protein